VSLGAALPRSGARISRLRRPSRALRIVGFTAAGLLVFALSIAVAATLGPADVSLVNVRDILLNHTGLTDIPVRAAENAIVWEERLPRALVAGACGAGLAVCGAVLQSLLRNPLADPFLLGISAGASTGVVAVVVLGLGVGVIGITAGAFLGSLIAFGLVIGLATLSGGGTARVILAGVAITQFFAAATSFIVITSADAEQTRSVLFWLLGSLARARWESVAWSAVTLLVVLAICLARAKDLDAFTFGTDAASSLGVDVRAVRALLLCATALLTAALVAAAGAIGFVGLMMPHAARLIVGPSYRAVLPVTAALGAILLVWVDTVARTAAAPQEIPVGVVTALVGVPAFALLLARRSR
jgi:iron complex transport system permease protein